MSETIARLDDMRLVAELTSGENFTQIARRLGMPKQTVSRRIGALETSLGLRLVERTTRSFTLSGQGRAYAERCAEIVRLADELHRAMRGEATEISGTLRVTADPLFGEHFLPPIVAEFARVHPSVRVDVVLTSRHVEVVEEGFDVAFRVGGQPPPSLSATRIAEASMSFVASKRYLQRRGTPHSPDDLARHDCIALVPEGAAPRWAFRDGWRAISPRVRVNHLGLAQRAAIEGLGIANIPSFAKGTLTEVLREHVASFGAIWVVHPTRRLVTPRTRAFRDLAIATLAKRKELRRSSRERP
jgi:DNA-binding transcriptional LysR family regulator